MKLLVVNFWACFVREYLWRWGITWWPRSSRPPVRWRCTLISYGMLVEHKQQILTLLLLLPHQLMLKLMTRVAVLLPAGVRLQGLLLLKSVIFISVLVPQPTTAKGPAASRETTEPTGGRGTKWYSCRQVPYYLQDNLLNRKFLVDTGASRSVFPHHSSAPATGSRLGMANGCPTKF